MDAVVEKLEAKLHEWKPETAQDALDFLRSREVEQEVLDILDAPPTR